MTANLELKKTQVRAKLYTIVGRYGVESGAEWELEALLMSVIDECDEAVDMVAKITARLTDGIIAEVAELRAEKDARENA